MKKKNLVFLHGFPFNSSCWDPQVSFFKQTHSVWAPDLRGHRDGPNGPGPWMIAHYVEDLKKFLDAQKINDVTLCGLSMGGYIALHFAKKYPEMMQGLVLCDTRPDADNNEAKDKRYQSIQKLHESSFANFAEEFAKNVLAKKTLTDHPEIQKNFIQIIKQNKPENLAYAVGALASRLDHTSFLVEISYPTLVIVGAEDKLTTPEVNKKMADSIPGAKFHIIENAGHISNVEQPEIFNLHMQQFLESYGNS